MVVGHAFSTSETISALTLVLKEAFLAYGIPKRLYVDYGKVPIIHIMLGFELCEDVDHPP
jgi:hypothetical protein